MVFSDVINRNEVNFLDCTLRDGGYYNAWDFPVDVIKDYITAMAAAQVDVLELGFRFIKNEGFKGACAFATDDFLRGLKIPQELQVAVMVNGADLLTDLGLIPSLERLFPETSETSPVDLVRVACHYHEIEALIPATHWLKQRGYRVAINLMQISDRSREEIHRFCKLINSSSVETLYFADSMGALKPDDVSRITGWFRECWSGPIGIHAHDNMGLALQNALRAKEEGASWFDVTVTGMGRGPGNAKTEELVIELVEKDVTLPNIIPLMSLIRRYFGPLKENHGWGTNPYYFLAGKHGIHPTYIQEMLSDARYNEEDMLAVIQHLQTQGGKKFSFNSLDAARNFYSGDPRGSWKPADVLGGKDVLILGTGPGVATHRSALEAYIRRTKPIVIALNTQMELDASLIDFRVACHPVRLLADVQAHMKFAQPLITPFSMLPEDIQNELDGKEVLDFGLGVASEEFQFFPSHCIAPNSLVIGYALAIAASGNSAQVILAGFDGYEAGDTRNDEMNQLMQSFIRFSDMNLFSVTPTMYEVEQRSIYAL
jgi:4-hydroxy 2-oxovalerate aldolase